MNELSKAIEGAVNEMDKAIAAFRRAYKGESLTPSQGPMDLADPPISVDCDPIIDPGEGYRALGDDEIVQKGDQYTRGNNGVWHPVSNFGYRAGVPDACWFKATYRRKVEPAIKPETKDVTMAFALKDLPEWARFVAQDDDGELWVYEEAPELCSGGYCEADGSKVRRIGKLPPGAIDGVWELKWAAM